jgi:hypothetical protein
VGECLILSRIAAAKEPLDAGRRREEGITGFTAKTEHSATVFIPGTDKGPMQSSPIAWHK